MDKKFDPSLFTNHLQQDFRDGFSKNWKDAERSVGFSGRPVGVFTSYLKDVFIKSMSDAIEKSLASFEKIQENVFNNTAIDNCSILEQKLFEILPHYRGFILDKFDKGPLGKRPEPLKQNLSDNYDRIIAELKCKITTKINLIKAQITNRPDPAKQTPFQLLKTKMLSSVGDYFIKGAIGFFLGIPTGYSLLKAGKSLNTSTPSLQQSCEHSAPVPEEQPKLIDQPSEEVAPTSSLVASPSQDQILPSHESNPAQTQQSNQSH